MKVEKIYIAWTNETYLQEINAQLARLLDLFVNDANSADEYKAKKGFRRTLLHKPSDEVFILRSSPKLRRRRAKKKGPTRIPRGKTSLYRSSMYYGMKLKDYQEISSLERLSPR